MIDFQTILDADRNLLFLLNGSNSLFVDNWMVALTCGFTWIALYFALLYLVVKNNENMKQIFLTIGCALLCVALADVMADVVMKPLVERWRPSTDPMIKYSVRVVGGMRGSDYGFFSAHAANTFALALFFCFLVRSKILSVSLVLWSLVNCYTRIYLGLHYPLDVLCGLLWGAAVACGVYYLYYRIYSRIAPANNYISTQYTSTGYSLDDVDVVELVLTATLLCTVLYAIVAFV